MLNAEPTDPGKSLLGLSKLFSLGTFLYNRLKQTFLQLTFSLLSNTEPIQLFSDD